MKTGRRETPEPPEGRYKGAYAPFPIRIRVRKTGRTHNELSIIAVRTADDIVIACGNDCQRWIDLPEEGVAVYCPFKNGAIADYDLAATLLRYFLCEYSGIPALITRFTGRSAVLCHPKMGELTEVERRVYHDCMMQAGCRKLYFFEGCLDDLPKKLSDKFDIAFGMEYDLPTD